MNGTMTTVLFPPPPKTTNTIDTQQRNRLVRSTRKLGSVLGTTPQVVESEQRTSHPPIPASLNLHPTGPRVQGKLRRPTTADSGDSSVFGTVSDPTPRFAYSAPSVNSSVVSLSMTPAEETLAPSRKRRPTLKSTGKRSIEIPPPLVLHLTAPSPKHHSLPQTPLTASTLTPGSSPALTPLTPVFPSPAESRRKRMAKLTRTLGEKIPPQLVLATLRKPSIPSLRSSALKSPPPLPPPRVSSFNEKAGRRRSMSVDFVNVMNTNVPPSRSSRVWVTGNSTWWGEWNRKDIKDVQKQLRNLKAR